MDAGVQSAGLLVPPRSMVREEREFDALLLIVGPAGRLGIGVEQALASRYIAFSCYAWIGLLATLAILQQQGGSLRSPSFRTFLAGVPFGLVFACYFFDWIENSRSMRGHWAEQKNMLLTVQFISLIPDNPLLSHLLVDAKTVRDIALPLMERNILRRSPAGDWVLKKIDRPDGNDAGAFQGIQHLERPRPTRNRRVELRRNRGIHRCLGATGAFSQHSILGRRS